MQLPEKTRPVHCRHEDHWFGFKSTFLLVLCLSLFSSGCSKAPDSMPQVLPILFKNPGKTKVLKTDLMEIQHLKPALPMFPILAVQIVCLLLLTREALLFWKPLLWKQLLWRTLPLVIPLLHIR